MYGLLASPLVVTARTDCDTTCGSGVEAFDEAVSIDWCLSLQADVLTSETPVCMLASAPAVSDHGR